MNNTTYTAFETLLLFRGIAKYGLDENAFTEISKRLNRAGPVRTGATFNADRLSPKALQERFLDLLWDQIKCEVDAAPRPDGGSSPTSKKRKLQPPPRPKFEEAIFHVEVIEKLHRRVYESYVQNTVAAIRNLEQRYLEVGERIATLEEQERNNAVHKDLAPKSSAITKEDLVKNVPAVANGVVGPSPGASPQPEPRAQVHPTLLPQNTVQPTAPGTGSAPPSQAGPLATSPAPPAPALEQPQTVPQSEPQGLPQPLTSAPKPPSGVSPVLQLPQGLPPSTPVAPPPPVHSAAEGLQRPEDVKPKDTPPPPLPPTSQPAAQGQLKWGPPYQPGGPMAMARPVQTPNQQQMAQGLVQPPQPLPQQRIPQPAPRPLQAQSAKSMSPPVLASPQPAGQYPPTLQPAPARSAVEPGGVPVNRPPLLAPGAQPSRAPHAIFPQGYTQPVQGRSAVPTPVPTPPVAPALQRPHPGATQLPPPPPPPRASNQPLQPPSSQPQLGSQPASPSPAFPQPDVQRGYSSPYTAPRPAVPDRILPQRLPSTPTPAPPTRITPVPFAPQTPAATLSQRLVTGSNTKWGSVSTPSTPIQGPASLFSTDIPESPAYEQLSPVIQPAVLPATASPLTAPPIPAPQEEPQKAPQPESKKAPHQEPKKAQEEQKKASPVPAPEQPTATPPKRKAGRPRNTPRALDVVSPPKPVAPPLALPPAGDPPVLSSLAPTTVPPTAEANEPEPTRIKDEVTTPRPLTETGDTTADESVAGRRQAPRHAKRKREELSPTPVQTPVGNRRFFEPTSAVQPAEAPTEVLWTRQFNKVCGSAMEQIIHHRFANMFAAPIREKDAPGYRKVILQPQDLKSIKAAINAGNRAASQAAVALPGGDPNTSSVWLPVSEGLMPPKGIINSGQLDREFAHMFSNAIMYNPDHGHGPGPSFLVRDEESPGDDAEGGGAHAHDAALGYKVDEFGVVNDARAMFSEVEKLLSELRSAEVRRTGGRAGVMTGTSTRQASAHRDASQARDEGGNNVNNGGDDADEHTATEAETPVGNVAKRRRTTRG